MKAGRQVERLADRRAHMRRPDVTAERLADRRAHMRRPDVTAERLADRRAHYFMDQQIGLHGTIVSLALGVAGLAAASLFEVSPADRPYHPLLWLLWSTSLVGVGTVYSGMTVSVYAFPSTIPSALDMFLPVGVGLMEFMLFAVLTSPLNSQLSSRSVVIVWFGCFCLFCCFASMVIIRVRCSSSTPSMSHRQPRWPSTRWSRSCAGILAGRAAALWSARHCL
jgi:hypothetical protein